MLAVSHLHNREYFQGAKGPARTPGEWRAMFPTATFYAESELLVAAMEGRSQAPIGWLDDDIRDGSGIANSVEAFSLVEGGGTGRALDGGLMMPVAGASLQPNPLWVDGRAVWPSERYRDEYEGGCLWALPDAELWFPPDPVRLRRVVDLPARW